MDNTPLLPMTKKMAFGSHFDLVSSAELIDRDYNIVQIYPQKVYTDSKGHAVFLCEVLDKESEDLTDGN